MKKYNKFLSVLLAVLVVFSAFGVMALAADETCDHVYTSVSVAPTCVEQGYTLHTCGKCGDFYKDSFRDPLGHNWPREYEVKVEASCSVEGLKVRECSRCHATDSVVIHVLEHVDKNGDGICDAPGCGTEVKTVDIFAPFDWLISFFRAFIDWFRAIFA